MPRWNPIKGPGKFEGELRIIQWVYEEPDEEVGSVDALGWYGRYSGKIKGRGPFHVIVSENSQGFVSGRTFASEKELEKVWDAILDEYDEYYEEDEDED
jgi:hypothetical protein